MNEVALFAVGGVVGFLLAMAVGAWLLERDRRARERARVRALWGED